jgi:hypothetical protein
MTPKSNQTIERHYFELFRRVYPLPEGQVKYGDRPDIIIEGPRKVGIELTNFFLERGRIPESEQNQKTIREDVLKQAQRIYLTEGRKPIEISFSFNKNHPIQKKKKLISKIVDLGRRLEAFETGEVSKHLLEDIQELSFVYVNSTLYSDPKWRSFQVYTVPIMSVQRLTDILREKENKAKNYSKCDAYWLLVVVDFINPAQDQEIRVDGIKLKSDIYEKIIVYKTAFEHVIEVRG